jgi:2'-5' RNA ligase
MADNTQDAIEATLAIFVPEVETLVHPFHTRYEPYALLGTPAHITINYPFHPGVDPSPDLHRQLEALFAEFDPFSFAFRRVARFPHVLYLPPEPAEPFTQLIERVATHFPESPPYSGAYESITPHLTVVQSEDEDVLDTLEEELLALAESFLPLMVQASEVWLLDNSSGTWERRVSFPLGQTGRR